MSNDFTFQAGEIKNVGIVISSDSAITISSPTVKIIRCSDGSTIVAETSASQVNDSATQVTLKYLLNTTGFQEGRYLAQFKFVRDSVETRIVKTHVFVSTSTC